MSPIVVSACGGTTSRSQASRSPSVTSAPLSRLNATLGGHNTHTAATTVRDFLSVHPDYPSRLLGKALQVSDLLFRAAAMSEALFAMEDNLPERRGAVAFHAAAARKRK
jgi:hypothetical protein